MSPTSRELVSNKALQGTELSQIILADVARMLADNGLLSGQTAYPRIAYELRLTLHLGLPAIPVSVDAVRSRPAADDAVARTPALAALEPGPTLAPPPPPPTDDATSVAPDACDAAPTVFQSTQLVRDIDSPNLARIEHSLPIEVTTMGQDGHSTERLVQYHPSDIGMAASAEFPLPDLTDVTEEQRKELGL
jgi:hypothetical protein